MHELSSSAAAPPTFPSEPPRSDASGDRPRLEDLDLPAAILDESGIVWDVNEAWRTSPVQVATVGQRYLDGLRTLSPPDADALSPSLDGSSEASGDVRERTVACHNNDSEHWLNVSISTVTLGGRRASLVLHQDATALRQMERRLRLSRSIASALVMPLDPALRAARLAVTIGEALQSSAVVLWERAPSGVLRARPLETSRLSPQVATIAHTRQLIGVMEGRAPQWIRLLDGTACFAVPLEAPGQVVIFHFPHRPRFDAETLRLVAHALHPSLSGRELARPGRGRSPREIRRQVCREENAGSPNLAMQERQHIERTLERCGYNLLRTAQALGIARSTLYERIKDYGIKVPSRSA